MTTKKKLIALALCVVILVATILSGTVAYFTDEHSVKNTFTSGNVTIKLDEAKVTKDTKGDLVANGTERFVPTKTEYTQNYGTIYPGMKITKDPTITNVGTESAYVAAKIVATNTNGIDVSSLLSGGILGNAKTTTVTDKNEIAAAVADADCDYVVFKTSTADTYTIYVFVKASVDATENVVLFDKMTIPAEWDNEEINLINALTIDVTGYGIQEYGFTNGYAAATEAFKSAFTF